MYKSNASAPFKPPRMRAVPPKDSESLESEPQRPSEEPPVGVKRQAVGPAIGVKRHGLKPASRPVSRPVSRPPTLTSIPALEGSSEERNYYFALWRKPTNKMHKTWDGDAVVIHNCTTGTLVLKGESGGTFKQLSRSTKTAQFTGAAGVVFKLGAYECEIEYAITDPLELERLGVGAPGPLSSGMPSTPAPSGTTQPMGLSNRAIPQGAFKPVVPTKQINPALKPTLKAPIRVTHAPLSAAFKPVVAPAPKAGLPLHLASEPNALCMPPGPSDLVVVVVDPLVSQHLRPHQRDGVTFLYECVMGLRGYGGQGALLADEMGLGKTLTTITLIWTLLKHPITLMVPLVRKVLIACPVTLIGNWEREFHKWLGPHRVGVLAVKNSKVPAKEKADVARFGLTRVYQVLIMGYERILTLGEELSQTAFDLVVCDEGHRLKNGANKSLAVLNGLNCARRVVLSGTPIQNDLAEFYQLIHFINPGVLGTFAQFQRKYMRPIQLGREVNCTNAEVRARGEEQAQAFMELTNAFTLRRTSAVMANHLPPRTDLVFFCPPTELQLRLFRVMTSSDAYSEALRSVSAQDSLSLINVYRKICSSPALLGSDRLFASMVDPALMAKARTTKTSGKLKTLVHLLFSIRKQSGCSEKVVLVSNYTQTLDLLQEILVSVNMTYCRLDGATPTRLRDGLVQSFNRESAEESFVFLLSAKSGGVGLNLVGASRLILFDNDWNPAVDLQAMARVHRDGQTKPVYIYRLLTTGCLDEKIFQRQLMKSNLSDKFLDDKANASDNLFDHADLKDLFTLGETACGTHTLMECSCEGTGEEIEEAPEAPKEPEEPKAPSTGFVSALAQSAAVEDSAKRKRVLQGALSGYRHIDPVAMGMEIDCRDEATEHFLKGVVERRETSPISYMFVKTNALPVPDPPSSLFVEE